MATNVRSGQAATHTMNRLFNRRRWLQAIGIVALVLIVGPEVSAAIWRARHAAPLGRSTEAVDRTLARLLPLGTPLDSAVAVLRAAGVDMWPVEAERADAKRDTSAAGGPIMYGITGQLDANWIVTERARIDLYFDASHRLVRRHVEASLTGP